MKLILRFEAWATEFDDHVSFIKPREVDAGTNGRLIGHLDRKIYDLRFLWWGRRCIGGSSIGWRTFRDYQLKARNDT